MARPISKDLPAECAGCENAREPLTRLALDAAARWLIVPLSCLKGVGGALATLPCLADAWIEI